MTIHDWTRVLPGTFHDQHQGWIVQTRTALNTGILPEEYYASVEGFDFDELACNADWASLPGDRFSLEKEQAFYTAKQSRVAIRHGTDDRLIALIEIMSSGNKSSIRRIREFADKSLSILKNGCGLLIVDLFPATNRDPQGIHGVIWEEMGGDPYAAPAEKPLTLASYVGAIPSRAYVEPVAVGDVLIPMPLFLSPTNYISIPLEDTYQQAYRGVPKKWKQVLEQE